MTNIKSNSHPVHTTVHKYPPNLEDEERIPLNPRCRSSSKRQIDERRHPRREQWIGRIAIGASILSLLLCVVALISFCLGLWNGPTEAGNGWKSSAEKRANQEPSSADRQKEYAEKYYDEYGRYVLEDYDIQPPFSNFLPGLAGFYGIPLYAFYVNRGQGIASFGFKSKEYPIQDFHSANLAYQSTAFTGFRTFLQISRPSRSYFHQDPKLGKSKLVEPFSALQSRFSAQEGALESLPKRFMYIGANEMQLQEIDYANGIETNVTFFILPEENFGAFVKRTTITNLPYRDRVKRNGKSKAGSSDNGGTALTLSMIDGLAKVVPAGGKLDDYLKNMGRTLEGWMGVYSPYNDTIQMPFYRLSMQPSDSASVIVQETGHWCLSLMERSGDSSNMDPQQPILLPIIHDPSKVFGDDTSLLRPVGLYRHSIPDIIHKEQQYGFAKTASAFAAVENTTLNPGESLTVTTFFGKASRVLDVPVIARRLLQPGFALFKATRVRELVNQITSGVETKTANPLFNGHVQQMFLDNSLRGGIPQILGDVDDDAKLRCADEDDRLKVYHLFSRKHGDLERDYNNFEIEPTFFSNGPGNFRDVAQNRRNDIFFNPRIGSFNIKTFLSFIQADGYEPLEVEAIVFAIDDISVCKKICARAVGEADGHRAQREALARILNSGYFRPGQLFLLMEQQNIELIISPQDFIDMVAASAKTFPLASYLSGYWADHWTYYFDLIDTYLSIYPDWEKRILFDEQLPYFSSPAFVNPRCKKYVLLLTYDGEGHHVRQLNATTEDDDDIKQYRGGFIKNTTNWYDYDSNWQHDEAGHVFTSSPIEKLFLLATLKFATRDPYGVALLYEGGKPGWDDANNGLVGMIGSGMPELYELAVLMRYIRYTTKEYMHDITIPAELYQLVEAINDALDILKTDYVDSNTLYPKVPKPLFNYWDTVTSAQEDYRILTKLTFSGSTRIVPHKWLDTTLKRWLAEIDLGIERGHKLGTNGYGDDGSSGVTPTYFSYKVTKWEKTGEVNRDGHPFVRAIEMEVRLLPLFLEGPTRMMKTVSSKAEAKAIYEKVRASPLRDEGLQMYTISASLKGQSVDLGREMAFAPGWLENQSIWLHMSYKFYLELLRHELYEEFFDEMNSGGMLPFMDPQIYGRSLMECSSFIASSAFEDPSVRGRGFMARLSGSTSEFLSMWVLMMIGPQPFYMDKESGQLRLQFIPALPRMLFYTGDTGTLTVSFKLFGAIDVTYYNHGGKDLFNTSPSRYVIVLRDGTTSHVHGPSIGPDLADKIRRVAFVASIEAYFH